MKIKDKFFTRLDWASFWTATLATFAVYAYTLGASVGLEDSGELATAAANLGVPHPPGYPFWTFCSWLFCKVFGWVTYMGHPTPAWCVSLCSAVFGALAAGCTAMLICRSSRDFLGGDVLTSDGLPEAGCEGKALNILSFGGGVAGALTFALSPVEWSQSTIVEIYSLNALFLMWVFLLSYRWMRKPSDKMLWFTAFVFGLGLTNYQVLVFAIVPLALIIALRKIALFRDFMLYLIPVLLTYQVLQIGDLARSQSGMSSDVINKHAPVGISDKQYYDKLTVDAYFGYFALASADDRRPYDQKVTELHYCARHAEAARTAARQRNDKKAEVHAEKAMQIALSELAVLERASAYVSQLDPAVLAELTRRENPDDPRSRLTPRSLQLKASTSRCPSGFGITLALVVLVGSLLTAIYFRKRERPERAMQAVLYGGGAGVALLFLSATIFASARVWENATLDTAPLVEPWIYAVCGCLVAASAVAAVAAALKTDASGFPKLTRRHLCIVSGVAAVLAVLLVLFCVPEAQHMALFGDNRAYGYTGEAYPWAKSIFVFLLLIVALFATSAFVKRGLYYAIPVAAFHAVLFLLTCRGAMNGLTHPASWWFWWPLAWNFVVLVLVWHLLPHGRSVAGAAFFAQLGAAFYAYMPIVSDLRNPPMNWGYPRTWEGFKHAITRGQYEAVSFKWPSWGQIYNYFEDVRVQFTDLMIPFALVPFAAGHWIVKKVNRKAFWQWVVPAFVCFFLMSFLVISLANVKGDLQDGFIQKVKFISSHAMLAMWIGYGLVFAAFCGLAKLAARRPDGSASRRFNLRTLALVTAAAMILVSFVYPLVDNYCGNYTLGVNEVAFKLGGSEQNDHTFGWQFGAYQLEGAKAINDQLTADEEPLPDPDWPEPMEKFSIFFGGTDPGRFVPTYMIYSALYRPDVYLITQNALADDTYMSVERDLYGDEIWIPSKEDSADAFNRYVDEVQSGKRSANGDLKIENGRVQVTGALGVMEINGILTEAMFKHDRLRHSFYVEESYVIPWMYPYLSPHGLIMKINKDKTPYDFRTAARDTDFWDWYVRRLIKDPMYRRDFAGQKSFSKLRAAIAGLYSNQGRYGEASQAFRESCLLYPASPEATFRYAQECLLRRNMFDAVLELMEYTDRLDPHNQRTERLTAYVRHAKSVLTLLSSLEAKRATKPGLTSAEKLEIAFCYLDTVRTPESARLVGEALTDLRDPNVVLTAARDLSAAGVVETENRALSMLVREIPALLAEAGRVAEAEAACNALLASFPNADGEPWLILAKLRYARGRKSEAVDCFARAVECKIPDLANRIGKDGILMEINELYQRKQSDKIQRTW